MSTEHYNELMNTCMFIGIAICGIVFLGIIGMVVGAYFDSKKEGK